MGKQMDSPERKAFAGTVAIIGFAGGVLWSALGRLAYIFNLTDIPPNAILSLWASGDWKKGLIGTVLSILLIGAASIAAAYLYYGLLRKAEGIWPGALFGTALFFLVFYILNQLYTEIPPVGELSKITVVTSVSFYILYGVFIGSSISFEEAERQGIHKNRRETTI